MKILQLTKHYPPYPGGIESVTYDIVEGINKMRYRSDVLCANDKWINIVEHVNNYRVWRMASFGKVMSTSIAPSIILQLYKLRYSYDIIHVHFPDPMNALALYLVRPKARVVVHWHSDIIKQKGLFWLYRPLQNWILKKADLIVGTSPIYINGSKYLTKYLNKTIAIPIGITAENIKSSHVEVEKVKGKYPGKKIIFSLGRLIYYKGFEFLIEAAKYLLDDVVILIGGEGKLYNRLKDQIQRNGFEKKIFLLGKISQYSLGNYYSACDIFCLPSVESSEAFGVVLLEAMRFGKPIVATNIPGSGVPWVNQNGVTGFNVEIRSPKALANGINNLLRNQGLYKEFSQNALRRFDRFFTSDKMVASFINEYLKMVNNK